MRMMDAGFGAVLAIASMDVAAAQPAPCEALLARMVRVDPAARASIQITQPDSQTCRFAPIRFTVSPLISYTVDNLTVQGLLPGGNGEVHLLASGVRNSPAIANKVAAYITRVGTIPFDLDVEYMTDPKAATFTLRQLAMTGEAIGRFELKAELTGVKAEPGSVLAPRRGSPSPDVNDLAVKSLELQLDNHGFVERMITPALAGWIAGVSPGADPEPLIEAQKVTVAGFLRGLPPSYGLQPGTADALARFVTDFPHPGKPLHCSAMADPPAKPPAGGPRDPATLQSFVAALHPLCTYSG